VRHPTSRGARPFPLDGAASTSILALAALALLSAAAASQGSPTLLHTPSVVLHSDQPIATGDIDGDGHLDLVCHRTLLSPPVLAVHRGDGLGGFLPAVTTSVLPALPQQLSTGDFDGDGRSDVAFLVKPAPAVQVLQGASDGTLVAPQTLTLAQSGPVRHLVICDATGDGLLDIVAAQAGTNRLSLFVGGGDGSFVAPPTELIAALDVRFLASGDVDGDGDEDLVLTSGPFLSPVTAVMWGQGHGTFDLPVSVPGTRAKAVADLDGDGRDDLVAHGYGEMEEGVWSWDPGQGFTVAPIEALLPEDEQRAIAAGDLDRDGVEELLLAYDEGHLDVFAAVGGGPFEVIRSFDVGTVPTSLHTLDLNQDGDIDVVAGGVVATVLTGQGDGELEPGFAVPAHADDMAVADMTGDELPDVVTVAWAGGPAWLHRGLPGGGLGTPEAVDVGGATGEVLLLELTGDGIVDILTAGSQALALAAGHGDGSFDPPVITLLQPGTIRQVVPAEFGGDDLVDLAVLRSDPLTFDKHHVSILINGGGRWVETDGAEIAPPGLSAYEFRAADVDGDLDTDLVAHGEFGVLRVFLNEPGGFQPGVVLPVTMSSFELADVDADGDTDILSRHDDVQVRLGDGTGQFAAPTTYVVPDLGASTMLAQDLDRDGFPDLVVTSRADLPDPDTDKVSVALGLGDGSFGPFAHWALGDTAYHLHAADMNQDGATDLVLRLNYQALVIVENGQGPWTSLGHSLAGSAGWSRLEGFGPLTPGSPVTLRASNGPPFAPAVLIAGPTAIFAPFKGGVLVPLPVLVQPLGALDAEGSLQVGSTWPANMPPGASFAMQIWRPEPGAPSGFAATTAIRGTTP